MCGLLFIDYIASISLITLPSCLGHYVTHNDLKIFHPKKIMRSCVAWLARTTKLEVLGKTGPASDSQSQGYWQNRHCHHKQLNIFTESGFDQNHRERLFSTALDFTPRVRLKNISPDYQLPLTFSRLPLST